MVLVFAGSYKEFRMFLWDRDLNLLNGIYRYVGDTEHMLGCLRGTPYLLVGTYCERDDFPKFLRIAEGKNFTQMEVVNGKS